MQLKSAKISFSHCAHTQANGEPAHGEHDPKSTPIIWCAWVNVGETMTKNDFIKQ